MWGGGIKKVRSSEGDRKVVRESERRNKERERDRAGEVKTVVENRARKGLCTLIPRQTPIALGNTYKETERERERRGEE